MSKIRFLNTPFPDNHDGFDYAPQSVNDLHVEHQRVISQAEQSRQQNNLMSMLASIFN